MAAASDKARFYLEQYVPELQKYERNLIFTRDEVTAITKKRSDFEHILNARGSTPGDYVRYATYEMNLDALRKKRSKRIGVKNSKTFNGQRTIFFILDRATKKFPGDKSLWMQYVQYCQKEKAGKKLTNVFASMLRLHPTDSSLWVLAAKHYAETQGDMGTARSYMQRGLRFCKNDPKLYLAYARLEMIYLSKIAARRKILGLDQEWREVPKETEDDDGTIALPTITAEDFMLEEAKGTEEVNVKALEKMADAPAFTGEIPIAIFDAATKQIRSRPAHLAQSFFDMFASFDAVPATQRILQHVLAQLQHTASRSPEEAFCQIRLHFFGLNPDSADLPIAIGKLRQSVKGVWPALSNNDRAVLSLHLVTLLIPYIAIDGDRDEDVLAVLESLVKQYLTSFCEARRINGSIGVREAIGKLDAERAFLADSDVLMRLCDEAGIPSGERDS